MKKLIILLMLVLMIGDFVLGQEKSDTLLINLADNSTTVRLSKKSNQNYVIKIINFLPTSSAAKYDISIVGENRTIEAIEVAGLGLVAGNQKKLDATEGNEKAKDSFLKSAKISQGNFSTEFYALSRSFKETDDESKIFSLKQKLEDLAEIASSKSDINLINSLKEELKDHVYNLGKLEAGEEVVVTIKRENKKWVHTYEVPEKKKWLVNYGFTFLADLISRNDLYHLKATSTNTFKIAKDNDSTKTDWTYQPTIMFSWFLGKNQNRFGLAFTGGLGLSIQNPTVLAGISMCFWRNIYITTGLGFQQTKRLVGEYAVNQELKENISAEKLHKQVYAVNPFVCISFRFDQNPFKSSEKPK